MIHFSSLFSSINWHWVWLVVAAFLAGVLNAVAGGGSFLSFPAMMGMNVLPVQANATNTVAIWPGQADLDRRVPRRHTEEPELGVADGAGGPRGRHGRSAGAAEYAADDVSAPCALASAGGRIDLCCQWARVRDGWIA